MNWQIFLTISILSMAISALLQKALISRENVHPFTFAAIFQIVVSLFVGVVLIFKGFHLPDLSSLWLNLILMVVLYTIGNVIKLKSLKEIEASEFTIIFQVSVLVTVLLAIVFLKETFFIKQFLGLGLVVVAVVMVTAKERLRLRLSKGEFWALLTAIVYGTQFANDAYILRSFDVWTYTFLAFLLPGLLTLAIAWNKKADIKNLFARKNILKFLSSSLLTAIAAIAIYSAYQVGRNAAQISSLNQLTTIIIVILAAIFIKERDRLPVKFVAAVLSVIGVILLK